MYSVCAQELFILISRVMPRRGERIELQERRLHYKQYHVILKVYGECTLKL